MDLSSSKIMLAIACLFAVASAVRGGKPSLDAPTSQTSVLKGQEAVLACAVEDLGDYTVTWTDKKSKVLTNGDRTIVQDRRISILRPYTRDWNLHIQKATSKDGGQYICQINTSPIQTKTVTLTVETD